MNHKRIAVYLFQAASLGLLVIFMAFLSPRSSFATGETVTITPSPTITVTPTLDGSTMMV